MLVESENCGISKDHQKTTRPVLNTNVMKCYEHLGLAMAMEHGEIVPLCTTHGL
jgi:hypothetical protein